jgi:ATP-binding cassette, subfamily B, multidrug efflux pump
MYAGKVGRGRNDGSDKAKHKKYVLRRLWDYLYFYKTKLFIAIFLTIVANVLSLIGPFLTGRTVDAMTDGVDFDKVFLFAGLMILFLWCCSTFELCFSDCYGKNITICCL